MSLTKNLVEDGYESKLKSDQKIAKLSTLMQKRRLHSVDSDSDPRTCLRLLHFALLSELALELFEWHRYRHYHHHHNY